MDKETRDALRDEYRDAKAEARACGDFDFPSFEEWMDEESMNARARARAEAEWNRREDEDTLDLY